MLKVNKIFRSVIRLVTTPPPTYKHTSPTLITTYKHTSPTLNRDLTVGTFGTDIANSKNF